MIRLIKKLFNISALLKLFLRMEFKKNLSLGFLSFLQSSRKGFFSISRVLYDFTDNPSATYISDWTRLKKISNINDRKKIVLDDKLLFHMMNSNNPNVIPIVAITKNNKIFRKIQTDYVEINVETEFVNFVAGYINGLIIKPVSGGGGGHISKVYVKDGNVNFRGECKDLGQFIKKVLFGKRDFILTEIIVQDGICSEIYPKTLNSVRILTMIDPVSNKPFIAAAVQRFGTSKSVVVDNWSAGGISADVNKETGELGLGASYPKSNDLKLKWFKVHPDTNNKFYGEQIPNWEYIKTSILQMSADYYYLPYIGWDVVPMANGFYILEGNTNSDVNLLQIHRGLLADSRNKSFFKYYNVT